MSETKRNIVGMMRTYTGTKTIKATTMSKAEYCAYRGWEVPENEDPNEKVYLVEYEADPNSKPNHPDHEGYISMSPAHVFEKAYKKADSWLDRLIIEKDELEAKAKNLDNALAENKVPADQREVLIVQYRIMMEYLSVLNARIENVPQVNPPSSEEQ